LSDNEIIDMFERCFMRLHVTICKHGTITLFYQRNYKIKQATLYILITIYVRMIIRNKKISISQTLFDLTINLNPWLTRLDNL